jgi:hypothetical protein
MPPRGKAKLQLGDSWVVEEDEDCPLESTKSESPALDSPPQRQTRRTTRSPDPEFVMPPLDRDTLEASWADSTSRSTRLRGGRLGEGGRNRRSSRHDAVNDSLEKRGRRKATEGKTATESRGLKKESSNLQDILEACADHGGSVLTWVIDVLGGAFRVLKTPISYALAIWLLFGIFTVAQNFVTNSVYASLSPLCRIPGVSILGLPFCPAWERGGGEGGQPPVEFDQLMKVQGEFEQIMEESAGRASLPLDMKRGEASIRDLRQLVRYSALHSK